MRLSCPPCYDDEIIEMVAKNVDYTTLIKLLGRQEELCLETFSVDVYDWSQSRCPDTV